jgi:hypothetical protein
MRSYPCIVVAVALTGAVANGACDGSSAPGVERTGAALMTGREVSEEVPEDVPECPTEESTCVEVAPPVPEFQACPRDRWIAYLGPNGGTCPESRTDIGWAGGSLFEAVGTGPEWGLAPGLKPFCAYDWTRPAPPTRADVDALRAHLAGKVAEMEPDCRVLVPTSSEIVDQSWEQLHEHVLDHVGALDPLPADQFRRPRTVRVAVLDSVPTGYQHGSPNTGESPHGWAVAHTIRGLSCPRPLDPTVPCNSSLSSHLALPLDGSGEVDVIHGGHYGRITDVGVALVDAVNAWRLYNQGRSPVAPDFHIRLVANMSVAWEPTWGGIPVGKGGAGLSPRTRAVYAAVTHLKCWGGIAIAAAGNDPGGPEPVTGAMLPARWETEPAPSASQCATFEGAGYDAGLPPLFPPAGTYNPLVHAVGALRADDRPIVSTRPAGRPRLAALGAHVVAVDRSTLFGAPTAVQTGSSMAAAIASGITSASWGYAPNMTGAQLMAHIFAAGTDLGQPANFCIGLACANIRRVELCSSIAAVCAAGGTRCPATLPACTTRPAGEGTLPIPTPAMRAAIDAAADAEAGVHPAEIYGLSLPPLDICRHDGFQTDQNRYAESTCPFRQWGPQPVPRPYAGPQPGGNPCPACWVSLSQTTDGKYRASVYLSVDPDYPYALTGGTLDIPGHGEIDLGAVGTLTPGDEAKIIEIPIDGTGPFEEATVNFRDAEMMVDGSYVPIDSASSNELVVWTE